MARIILSAATAVALVAVAGQAQAQARDQIRIVGSSTVFPFTTAAAERFGATTGFKTPVVESTGTGGGFKLFCGGVGESHPDFTNASRPVKKSEIETCAKNGVDAITEIRVGFDGIVLANAKAGAAIDVTPEELWLALARQIPGEDGSLVANPNESWNDVADHLPAKRIEVLGPPPTSGTRDAFVELVMEKGCEEIEAVAAIEDKGERKAVCATIREDGAWIDAGENDNLIVQKLKANPDAYGVFGYSFLEQNLDSLQGASVEGVEPTFENIADGAYPVSRSLFVYAKNAHVGVIPGMEEFIAEYTSEAAMGEEGYLADKGLIPLPEEARAAVRETATSLTPVQK